jgi:SAM-dependent methyltransferase
MASFDQQYFEKWYRTPEHRVRTRAELMRQASLVVSVAEFVLGRTIRRVLDVGCGEGEWYTALRALRPSIRYSGLEPSEYAVNRFGAKRNIRLGGVAFLHAFTRADDIEGDTSTMKRRSADEYRSIFHGAGLRAVGLACWTSKRLVKNLAELERP